MPSALLLAHAREGICATEGMYKASHRAGETDVGAPPSLPKRGKVETGKLQGSSSWLPDDVTRQKTEGANPSLLLRSGV